MHTCLLGGMRHLVRHASPQSPDRHSIPLHVVEQLALLGHGVSGFHPADDNLSFRRDTMLLLLLETMAIMLSLSVFLLKMVLWWLLSLLLSLMSDGRFRLHEPTIENKQATLPQHNKTKTIATIMTPQKTVPVEDKENNAYKMMAKEF